MKLLEGQTAIVTGASSGIGMACAIGLGKEGANVVVNYSGNNKGADGECMDGLVVVFHRTNFWDESGRLFLSSLVSKNTS